jgi:Rad3-related DNA helicase
LAGAEELAGRELHAYLSAKDRDDAVQAFKARGGVLLAPSLDRGIDLPDGLCRVVVVCKLPYPSLGDRRVSARLHRPGGQLWYSAQVARSLVQMTGRGVRHEGDWCVAWVLDRQFPVFYRKWGRKLLPAWWVGAITGDAST